MQEISHKSSKANSTSIVLLNTRTIKGYKSVNEMVKPDSETPWGNQFGLLHVSIPKFTNLKSANPLEFVLKIHKIIKKKRNSSAVYFTGILLTIMKKLRGPEVHTNFLDISRYSSSRDYLKKKKNNVTFYIFQNKKYPSINFSYLI